jgi:ribonuclease P protein component
VVPKRGRTTTDRNRLKRRLRELTRLQILPNLQPLDLVIHARIEAYDASFAELRLDLLQGISRVIRTLHKSDRA